MSHVHSPFYVSGYPDFATGSEAFEVAFTVTPPDHPTPWVKVRIDEASGWQSPSHEVETQDLDPIDVDPLDPQVRTVKTTMGAFEDGIFEVVFIDADDVEHRMGRVQRNASIFYDVRPTVEQLHTLLRARTYDENGNKVDAFSESTNPSLLQAEESIDEAVNYFLLDVGYNVPIRLRKIARSLVALCAAATIEASFSPEQIDTSQSSQKTLWAMYLSGLASFKAQTAGNAPNSKRAAYGTIQITGRRYGSYGLYGALTGSDACPCDECSCGQWERIA